MIIAILVALFIVFPISIWIFQWLWNSTIVVIFGAPRITFWQAFRLSLIASILFGGGYSYLENVSNSDIKDLNSNLEALTSEVKTLRRKLEQSQVSIEELTSQVQNILNYQK